MVDELAKVLVAELSVVHHEENEAVPGFVLALVGNSATTVLTSPEERQGFFEHGVGRLQVNLVVLGDALDDCAILIAENPCERALAVLHELYSIRVGEVNRPVHFAAQKATSVRNDGDEAAKTRCCRSLGCTHALSEPTGVTWNAICRSLQTALLDGMARGFAIGTASTDCALRFTLSQDAGIALECLGISGT